MPGGFENFSGASKDEPEQEQQEQSSAASEPQSQEAPESVRFEDLQQEFQEIEDKLTSEAFDIPAEDRVKLVHRILEHSLDDGLRFAKQLGLSKENLRKGMLRPKFAIKHPELIEELAEYFVASNENDYVWEGNEEVVEKFADIADKLKNNPENLADRIQGIQLNTDKAKDLKEDIDSHYIRFLKERSLEENIPIDSRTEGVKKAEEVLKKAKSILKEQYYPQGVFEVLGNELNTNLADATRSRREDVLSNYTDGNLARKIAYSSRLDKKTLKKLLSDIAGNIDSFDTDHVFEELETHRANPIREAYEMPKEEAVRTLKGELKDSLGRKHSSKNVDIRKAEKDNEFIIELDNKQIRHGQEAFVWNEKSFDIRNIEIEEYQELNEDSICNIDGSVAYKFTHRGEDKQTVVWEGEQITYPRISELTAVNGAPAVRAEKERWREFVYYKDQETGEYKKTQEYMRIDYLTEVAEKPAFAAHHRGANDWVVVWGDQESEEYGQVIWITEVGDRPIFRGDHKIQGWDYENDFSYIHALYPTDVDGEPAFVVLEDTQPPKYSVIEDGKKINQHSEEPRANLTDVDGSLAYSVINEKGQEVIIHKAEEVVKKNSGGVKDIADIGGELAYISTDFPAPSIEENPQRVIWQDWESPKYTSINNLTDLACKPAFIAEKENGEEVVYYNGDEHSFEGEIQHFSVEQGDILIVTEINGNLREHKAQFDERTVLSEKNKKKLRLLNMLADEGLEEIRDYFREKEKGKGEEKSWRESIKDFLSSSNVFAGTVAEAKRQDPQAFLETASAKSDNLSWEKVEDVAYEILPEIRWNREAEKYPDEYLNLPEAYLADKTTHEFRDADPKLEGEAVFEMRNKVDDLVVSNVLGAYDQNTKQWEQVQFPVQPELQEPVEENTFTIPDTNYLSSVKLPKVIGSEIITDRVKGITEEGKEVQLSVEENPLGEVTVEVPDEVEKIIYSQRKTKLPMRVPELTAGELKDFQEDFKKHIGQELTESLPGLPDDLKFFVKNNLKGLSPKDKLAAIEEKVREIGVYDFDNGEVMDAKKGVSVAEKIRIMRNRADDLKSRGEVGEDTVQYAGVCADFALLTAAMLREAGFPAGVISGFRPSSKQVTTAEAHGTAFVVWPHEKGNYKVIPVDGTPGAGSGGEIVDFQENSLEEKEFEYEKRSQALVEESKERMEEVEEIIESHDQERLAALSNGELEEILNILLEHGVKENHVQTLKTVLNASRYSPASIEKLNLEDPEDKQQFQSFVKKEIERARAEDTSRRPAGAELMSVMQEFIRRYERDYETEEVFDMLEEAVEAIADNLEEIEAKSALTTLHYLRAERMQE